MARHEGFQIFGLWIGFCCRKQAGFMYEDAVCKIASQLVLISCALDVVGTG